MTENKPDWPRIKADYVETAMTLAELHEKWNIPRGTISARATRENWHSDKQQFAANLEQIRRKQILAKRAAEQEQFENNILKIATGQLGVIVRQMQDEQVDASKVLKLASALEKVQRIGSAAFGKGDCST